MRKSKVKILASILAVVAIILIAALAIIFIGKKMMDEYKAQIDDMQYEMDSNKQIVYVASKPIVKGEPIQDGVNVFTQEIYTGLETESYMPAELLGSIAVVDITENDPIMANMITSLTLTNDTREYEITTASLMTDQADFDYVDVRILFPNGEDFLVLAKKPVNNLNLEACVFTTYMNEDEILRMSSAIIDAFSITGTRIYTSRYVESNLQETAIPNYYVKAETIDLINKDPNITKMAEETLNLQARMDLESRLKGVSEDQLKAVSEGHGLADTAKNSVLLNNTYYVSEDEMSEWEDGEEESTEGEDVVEEEGEESSEDALTIGEETTTTETTTTTQSAETTQTTE